MQCLQISCTEHKSARALWALCIGSLLGAVLLSLCVGAVAIAPAQLWQALFAQDTAPARILWHVRVPRTAATLLAGAALAVAGAVIQAVLHNPLAGPNIIGVNAGAGLGAVLCMALLPALPMLTSLGAFLGALAAVLLVYGVAQKTGASRMTLVLAGVAVNAVLSACIDTTTTLFPDALQSSNAFKIGGVSGAALKSLSPAWAVILVAILAVWLLHHELDVLELGDETAQSLGLSAKTMRRVFLVLAAALAGAAVSFAGLLGFIGLLVPHAVRFFTGSESGRLIPACAVLGAAFLTICDVLARSLFSPYEIPVGILLSLLGGPFFLSLLVRRRGHD